LKFANRFLNKGDTAMKHHVSFRGVGLTLAFLISIDATVAFGQDRCQTPAPTPEQMQQIRDQLNQWIQFGNRVISGITTIPVAFHVVRFNDGSANVTDVQIQAQVDTLNAGYATSNFRFSLRSIERVNHSDWQYPTYGSQQELAMKQALAVDPAHVLNFYTADLPGGDLGFARFPNEFPENSYMHGVVCDYASLPGGSISGYNLGKTGTHEIGHYVALWHTFQNGCTPPGDEVEDTPYEASPASGCPEGRNTCPAPGLDPIHNFMDYSDDPCMHEFTAGQSARMDSMMSLYRPSMFGIQVTVDQKLQGGQTSVDSIGHWEGGPSFATYAAPKQFTFSLGANEVLRGAQKIISNQKYNKWSKDDTVTNHRVFGIDGSFPDVLTSQFKTTDPTNTIKTDLLDAPGTTGGNIQFRDPWYIDYPDPLYGNNLRNRGMQGAIYHDRSSPFHPDFNTPPGEQSYRGVFLNQDYNIPGNPYYSVGAPNPNTINGFTSYFVNWTGTSVQFQNATAAQTGVVFTNSGATATARYKARLGYSSAAATGYNGQRKLVKRGITHHLVYHSRDDIWYTSSTDNGATWRPELLVSSGLEGTQRVNPAIDVDGLNNVFVVYEIMVDASQRAVAIKQRSGSVWDWLNTGDMFLASGDMKPVIEVTKNTFPGNSPQLTVVVQANGYTNYDPGLYYIRCPGNGQGIQIGKVSETSATSVNPTLAWYNLAYQDGNAIYHKRIDYTTTPVSFSARTLVSSNFVNGRL